jgi:polysaccharide pyruvyl transferase WcaK-like protein
MSSVLFDGYYGMQNIGDDVFCAVASAHAREQWGVARPAFVASPAHFPDVIGEPILPSRPLLRGQVRGAALARAVRCRHVVHAGGSTFHSMWGRFRDQAKLHRLGLITLHAAGVSVGPFESLSAGRQVGDFLRRFQNVTLRDRASLGRLADVAPDVSATLVPDLALHYPRVASITPHQLDSGTVGVTVARSESLRGGDLDAEERRLARVREIVVEYVRRTGARMRVFSFNGHLRNGDDAIARRTFPERDAEHVAWRRDTASFVGSLAACDLVVGIRLHGAVLASALGVVSITVPYHAKSREVLDGLGGAIVDEDGLSARDLLDTAAQRQAEAIPRQVPASAFASFLSQRNER